MSPERVELRKSAFDGSFSLVHVYIQLDFVILLYKKKANQSRHIRGKRKVAQNCGIANASRQGTSCREVEMSSIDSLENWLLGVNIASSVSRKSTRCLSCSRDLKKNVDAWGKSSEHLLHNICYCSKIKIWMLRVNQVIIYYRNLLLQQNVSQLFFIIL